MVVLMNEELLNALGYSETGTFLTVKPLWTPEKILAGQVWMKVNLNQWQNVRNNTRVAGSVLARAYTEEVWWLS